MTSVGVVICAYTDERWTLLETAVESVRKQDVDAAVVLVIDHNDELLSRAAKRWPEMQVIANRHQQGLSGARNSGVESLDTDVIAFLDDDASAEAGWLDELVKPFADDRIGLTSGRVLPDWKLGAPAWFPEEFLWVVGSSYTGLPLEASDVRNPIGASMAVRRQVFVDVGLFSDGIGRVGTTPLGCEETELAIRAAAAGHGTRYAPASVVRHHVSADRHSLRYFLRRCRAEGVSKAVVAELAGSDAALSAERSYVTKTIPAGVLGQMKRAVIGPRKGAVGATGALLAGCTVTAWGYGITSLRRRITPGSSPTTSAPRLGPSSAPADPVLTSTR